VVSGQGRLKIGDLQTNGPLQAGASTLGKGTSRYDLWLVNTGTEWQLEAFPPSSSAAAGTGAKPVTVGLTRTPTKTVSPMLSVVLIPDGRETGRLVVKWGEFVGSTSLKYTEMQLPRGQGAGGGRAAPINRRHDEPNPTARFLMLAQLNETALVLPKGSRFSASFARTFPKGQRTVSAAGTVLRAGPSADGPDFARLMSTRDGAVVELTESPVPKFTLQTSLRFGRVLLKAGNQAPGYPGAYGLWLKRAGRGWRLVFNQEPDIWGTQHDSKTDVGDVELTHTERGDATRPFSIALEPLDGERGRLLVQWGPHDWTADFTIVN
jgi:hypothetical protein